MTKESKQSFNLLKKCHLVWTEILCRKIIEHAFKKNRHFSTHEWKNSRGTGEIH